MGMHFFITNHTWFLSTKNIRRSFWWNLICSRTWFCNSCKKKWQCVKWPMVKHISLYGYTNPPSFIFWASSMCKVCSFPVLRYWVFSLSGITVFFEEKSRYYDISSSASDGKLLKNWSVFRYFIINPSNFPFWWRHWQKFWRCDCIRDPTTPLCIL